jgi:hypothetical protein
MKLTSLGAFGFALVLVVSACSTGSPPVPASTPLTTVAATTIPTVPPATPTTAPTAVPTAIPTTAPTPSPVTLATTAPTSTSAARAVTAGAAASASDLKSVADAVAAATTYRVTITVTGATQAQSGTVVLAVVKPDRLDTKGTFAGRSFETIAIGSDTYIKNGTTWVKSPIPNPVPAMTGLLNNDPQKLLDQMASSQKNGTLTKGGADRVNGTPCQDWILTPAGTNTTSRAGTLCIGQNNLPVQFKSNDGNLVVAYSDWNTPISIVAPI